MCGAAVIADGLEQAELRVRRIVKQLTSEELPSPPKPTIAWGLVSDASSTLIPP